MGGLGLDTTTLGAGDDIVLAEGVGLDGLENHSQLGQPPSGKLGSRKGPRPRLTHSITSADDVRFRRMCRRAACIANGTSF